MSIQPPSYDVIQNLQNLQINYKLLDEETARAIRTKVIGKYTSNYSEVIWHNLLSSASLQNPSGWRMIDEYISGASFLLFFDLSEDKSMFEISAGSSLTSILDECPGFEFYITNHETSYLLCFNDHDFLIGVGEAAIWNKLCQ